MPVYLAGFLEDFPLIVLAVVQTAVPKGWCMALLPLQCESVADILNMTLLIATQF